jgi:hypothetical protein
MKYRKAKAAENNESNENYNGSAYGSVSRQ